MNAAGDPSVCWLLVEGETDAIIVTRVLESAQFPIERLRIEPAGGKEGVRRLAKHLHPEQVGRYAALIDLDERSVPDAVSRAREQLGNPPIKVFCAVPEVEAWLFADDQAVLAHAKGGKDVRAILARLPMPEEIPRPRRLAAQVLGPTKELTFLSAIDIQRAAARSPSLRSFLQGMGELLGISTKLPEESVGRTISRDVLAGLIGEVLPADTIVWRTAGGEAFTAAELRKEIESGNEVGRQYASDLLRG
jgi:hypothetical protein